MTDNGCYARKPNQTQLCKNQNSVIPSSIHKKGIILVHMTQLQYVNNWKR